MYLMCVVTLIVLVVKSSLKILMILVHPNNLINLSIHINLNKMKLKYCMSY